MEMARPRLILAAVLWLLHGHHAYGQDGLASFASDSAILNAPCSIAFSILAEWPDSGNEPSVQAQVLAAYVAGFLDGIPTMRPGEVQKNEIVEQLQGRCAQHMRQAAKTLSLHFSEELFHDGLMQGIEDAKSEFDYLDDRPRRWE